MPDQTRLILVAPARVRDAAAFDAAPGGRAWDAVLDSAKAARAEAPRPVVSLPPNAPLPRVDGGGTLWLRDLDQVAPAVALNDGWQAIVFEPSDLSVLDHLRQRRETMAARGPIAAGAVLTEDDLAAVPGGAGISAEFRDRIVGCRVCYDLAAGDAITFGILDPPEGGDASKTGRSKAI